MNFNYLEIAEVVSKIEPATVENVELVEFQVRGRLADLNIALRLAPQKRSLVFSLKSPWMGVFYLDSRNWKPSRQTWSAAFGEAPNWNAVISEKKLLGVSSAPNDRVVFLSFSEGIQVEVQLFSARPNWILHVGDKKVAWREIALVPLSRPPLEAKIRDFSEYGSGTWMERCYQYYGDLRKKAFLESIMTRGRGELQAKLLRLSKARNQMQKSLQESNRAQEVFDQAQALKAQLHEKPELTLEMEKLFARYKKLGRTCKEVQLRLEGLEGEVKKVKQSLAELNEYALRGDDSYSQILDLFKRAGISAPLDLEEPAPKPKKKQLDWSSAGARRFESKEGLSIWVGRNHQENEKLVVQLARGNDLWFHLKGRPGAHAIIQLPREKSASLETLLDAATLVAFFSGIPKGQKVEVDYTFRKFVKRVPKSGEKFLVTYIKNKTLMIEVEEPRLSRLMTVTP